MGHGTVSMLILNRLRERHLAGIGVRDINNTTQKERRIIDTISPVTRRHRLVVHERAIHDDIGTCMPYSRDRRWLYSAFAQLAGITYDRGSLAKDDRADAIAMMVAVLNGHLVEDEKVVAARESEKQALAFINNPLDWAQGMVQKQLRGVAARLQGRGRGKQHRGRR